ncbi:MAG: 50S ribosomal protein L5 [Planctomycetota bacterium]|nr:50S ribosomal protein L5 [Planctomycetota bacterium]
MVAQKTKTRLDAKYQDEIAPKLMEKFGLRNRLQLPNLSKIVINVAIGRHLENQKLKQDIADTVIATLTQISGQQPVLRMAKKSVANFKVREGAPSGYMVTLRQDRMWHFLDRLMNLAMPRIRDFRGVKAAAFDKEGNYSVGLTEQAVWPEINMAQVTFVHGMNINLCFERSNPDMSRFLLEELGMPFERKEDD